MKKNNFHTLKFLVGALLPITFYLLSLHSCANRGVGPQGGPVDSIPPVIVKMTVPNGTRNVQTKKMSIYFDEYILLDGATDKILISPPQQRQPEIKAVGKRIDIEFKEDLQPNTTYTIDFDDLIVDNNEKNPLQDFSFSFSTGDNMDSLEVYGQLINAEDLNPISGVVIGLHDVMDDSVFSTRPFTRIGRTNEEGEFSIKNIHSGTYRIYALQDQSRDYLFQPGEGLAFQEETITPYMKYQNETDTIYLEDTLDANGQRIPDSVVTAEYFYYEPSDLLLRFFKEDYQRQYFKRVARKEAHVFQLFFGAPQQQLPTFTALRLESDSLMQDTAWVDFLEHSWMQTNKAQDTITFWLADSAAIQMDSIRFAMTYLKSDSLMQLQPQTDTLYAVYRAPRMTERAKKNLQQKQAKMGLDIQCNAKSTFAHFDTLALSAPTPIRSFTPERIHLQIQKDTLWEDVTCRVEKADSTGSQLYIIAGLRPDNDYQIVVDSDAVQDIYNKVNKKDEFSFHVRPLEDYATITIFLQPSTENIYIQMLNAQDQPVRQLKADPQGTLFQYMEPGVYYMRLFIDENGDGKWTTGSFKEHRQPEQVFYFPKKLNLRANWTFEETFNWQAIPLLEQKPAAIRKDAAAQNKK